MGHTGDRTLFVITCQSSVKISHLSTFPVEAEVLLPFGIRLSVHVNTIAGGGLRVIALKEEACEGLVKARELLIESSPPSPPPPSSSLLADRLQAVAVNPSTSHSLSPQEVSYSPHHFDQTQFGVVT